MSTVTSPPILLVEDNEDDAFFILKAFHSLDLPVTVRHCRNGQEAMQYLQPQMANSTAENALPQLVVLDLKMPQKSGFDVLAWIRSQPRGRPLVVVILTSFTSPNDMEKADQLGVNAYWIKPIGLKDMKEVARCTVHLWLNHTPALLQKNIFELAS